MSHRPTLTAGQCITISGAAGTCPGTIIRSESPAELPEINGPAELARVRAIMAEWGVEEIAAIEHLHDGQPVMFCALRDQHGNWRDLRGQPLTITQAIGTAAAPDAREQEPRT